MNIDMNLKLRVDQELAKRRHLDFMRYCWQRPDNFIIGYHTKQITSIIDKAVAQYRKGISSFIAIKCCFRHGKSDMISRYFPPHFLGEFPDKEVITAAYSSILTDEFSKFGRMLIQTPQYGSLYPKVRISKKEQSVSVWGIHKHLGKAQWLGLGGSLMGRGGDLIILDDFHKSREEAESETVRNATWEGFLDIMTRRAPVCIVIVLATPWHTDDVFGRIKKRMQEDPLFPMFEEVVFGARDDRYYDINGTPYLFPERFNAQWYEEQYSTLGPYRAAGLMDCNPVIREGNLFEVEGVKTYKDAPVGIRWTRGWDLASSEKQKVKDDPDYTSSIKLGVMWKASSSGEPMPVLYIDDFTIDRMAAPARDKKIARIAKTDGAGIQVGIEAYGPYKDAYQNLSAALHGVRTVHKVRLPGDKVSRAEALEPAFHAGNVYMREAPWNTELIRFLSEFPGGAHDDPVDALVTAFAIHKPFMKHMFPYLGAVSALPFEINWGKQSGQESLHYAAIVMNKDLSLWIIGALWDSISGELFVYICMRFDDPDIKAVVAWMTERLRLKKYRIDKLMCNKLMSESKNDTERTVQRLFRAELRERKIEARVTESLKFDLWGSVGIVNELTQTGKMHWEVGAEGALIQSQMWVVDGGKPAEGDNGWCEGLLMIVSELKKRKVFEGIFRRRDYMKEEKYNKMKAKDWRDNDG